MIRVRGVLWLVHQVTPEYVIYSTWASGRWHPSRMTRAAFREEMKAGHVTR